MTALDQIKQANLTICFTGEKHGWHLCSSKHSKLLCCISVDGNKAGNSGYGDKHHVKRLMANGWFDARQENITEAGLEFMSGIYSQLMVDSKGKKWAMLGFK